MNLVLYLSGGKNLVDQLVEATRLIKESLNGQTALVAAIEVAERQYWLTSSWTEEGFKQTWNSLEPKLMFQTRQHHLKIPGTRLSAKNSSYRQYLEEELAFLQASVFEDLIRRIETDPLKVLQDGLRGKLENSLAMAGTNDLRDRIKALRAQKRDMIKEVFTGSQHNTGADNEIVDPGVQTPAKITQAFSSVGAPEASFEELIEGLNDDEKRVLTLIYQREIPENSVAVELHRSAAWVTKIKKERIEKLRQIITWR